MKISSPFWISFLGVAGCHIEIKPGPNRIDKFLHSLCSSKPTHAHTSNAYLPLFTRSQIQLQAKPLLLLCCFTFNIALPFKQPSSQSQCIAVEEEDKKEKKNNELRIYKMCLCSIPEDEKNLEDCTRKMNNFVANEAKAISDFNSSVEFLQTDQHSV